MDVPSSFSKSGWKPLPRLRSFAYASGLKHWALGRGVCIYTYLGGTPSMSDKCAAWLIPGGTGGVPGGYGVRSGVGYLCCSGGCAPVPLRLQRVWGFCVLPFRHGRQPSVWLSQSIAGCLSIAGLTFSCPGISTLRFFSAWTSARGVLMRSCVASFPASENPLLAIMAKSKASRMSDCFSCTGPPCLA